MGGSHSKPVTVDISRYPGGLGDQVKQDDKGGLYYEIGGKVLLTDEWFPDPEGTYRKITHTPKDGQNISKISKGGQDQILSPGNLSQYSSVSVYYWGQDHHCSKPLLIQLGSGNEYYKYVSSGNSWNKDGSITSSTLREKLDKQNCSRNKAHIINLEER
ncbi:hypothetical protein BEWA_054140 [Theileria equi strain WA]|uniref:Uncharacterized protein n=1 Tax=Theileria equi strain WA TaxID=1537102 RepID=L1LDY4_THEEQ|nr:hypothetical protein BEWA_054140 [Theileria equi strain WA]EKX73358.1 hypothetical protein BEWA_054140 [Theileria equi strain WA]|eukprot:XP_004832810.1 hypothetical protein BEWA_054140 [Theileria equi strain WA]